MDEDTIEMLERYGCKKYVDLFRENEIDKETIHSLEKADLVDTLRLPLGAALKLLKGLKEEAPPASVPSTSGALIPQNQDVGFLAFLEHAWGRNLTAFEKGLLISRGCLRNTKENYKEAEEDARNWLLNYPKSSFLENCSEFLVDGDLFHSAPSGHSYFFRLFDLDGKLLVGKQGSNVALEWKVLNDVNNSGGSEHIVKGVKLIRYGKNHKDMLVMEHHPTNAHHFFTGLRTGRRLFRESTQAAINKLVDKFEAHMQNALKDLHRSGWCYGRDLKEENVLMAAEGRFVLCDFEFARKSDSTLVDKDFAMLRTMLKMVNDVVTPAAD